MFANASNEQISQIQAILVHLDQGATARADNRRRACRVNIRTGMKALLLGQDAKTNVTIYSRNISTSGIGFVSRRMFKVGERVAVPFEVKDHPHKLVLAKVTFCRYVKSGLYTIGAEFIEAILDEGGPNRIPAHWIPDPHAREARPAAAEGGAKTPAKSPEKAPAKDSAEASAATPAETPVEAPAKA